MARISTMSKEFGRLSRPEKLRLLAGYPANEDVGEDEEEDEGSQEDEDAEEEDEDENEVVEERVELQDRKTRTSRLVEESGEKKKNGSKTENKRAGILKPFDPPPRADASTSTSKARNQDQWRDTLAERSTEPKTKVMKKGTTERAGGNERKKRNASISDTNTEEVEKGACAWLASASKARTRAEVVERTLKPGLQRFGGTFAAAAAAAAAADGDDDDEEEDDDD